MEKLTVEQSWNSFKYVETMPWVIISFPAATMSATEGGAGVGEDSAGTAQTSL